MQLLDVTVIGAGPAGLSTAYELKKAGLIPLVLERTPAVGDVWRNHYDGLRLNTGRFFSALPGSVFPRSAGAWPARDEVVRLLETFPAQGDFIVQTGIDIEKVNYDHDRDIWLATSSNGNQFKSRAVVMAIGTCRIPKIPEWEGRETFPGKIIHSSTFKRAQDYVGKRVLVIGSGNSAAEIACRLTEYANSVTMSIRTPPYILPKSICGIPFVGWGIWLKHLPNNLIDMLLSLVQRRMIGDLTAYGLPFPSMPLTEQYATNNVVPILYGPFAGNVRSARIKIVGPIQKISGRAVHVLRAVGVTRNDDNAMITLEPEVIVAGTGFRTGIPELVQIPNITDEKGRPEISGDQGFDGAPRLYFIGQINPLSGQLREIRIEAGKIAKRIRRQLGTK